MVLDLDLDKEASLYSLTTIFTLMSSGEEACIAAETLAQANQGQLD